MIKAVKGIDKNRVEHEYYLVGKMAIMFNGRKTWFNAWTCPDPRCEDKFYRRAGHRFLCEEPVEVKYAD